MLAGNGSVGRDTPIAEGEEPEVRNGGDPIVEDPGEVVHDEPGAERAQRLVVDRHRDSLSGACRGEAEQNKERDQGKKKRCWGSHGDGAKKKRCLLV
uniref:Uncharacterized protein n=1 Tax=Arundo donax TaxID=35708 RepID=A0A0A9HFR6_ARUDO